MNKAFDLNKLKTSGLALAMGAMLLACPPAAHAQTPAPTSTQIPTTAKWSERMALSVLKRSPWLQDPALGDSWGYTQGLLMHALEALEHQNHAELPSEATVRGALQVPASGQPVLFLADHPLTGGYPVIANVARHHLDLAGQIPVGAKIRFNAISAFAPRSILGKYP